jgi:hypothetical protein
VFPLFGGCVELRLSGGPGQRFSDRPFCGGLSNGESGFEHDFRILQLRILNAEENIFHSLAAHFIDRLSHGGQNADAGPE